MAGRAGVSVDTVRYYERRGLLPAAERLPSGYRLYPEAAVTRIGLARRLQALGMSLDEIAEALRAHDAGDATCESERFRLEAVRDRLEARLAELAAVRDAVEATLARCEAGECDLVAHPSSGPASRASEEAHLA